MEPARVSREKQARAYIVLSTNGNILFTLIVFLVKLVGALIQQEPGRKRRENIDQDDEDKELNSSYKNVSFLKIS